MRSTDSMLRTAPRGHDHVCGIHEYREVTPDQALAISIFQPYHPYTLKQVTNTVGAYPPPCVYPSSPLDLLICQSSFFKLRGLSRRCYRSLCARALTRVSEDKHHLSHVPYLVESTRLSGGDVEVLVCRCSSAPYDRGHVVHFDVPRRTGCGS